MNTSKIKIKLGSIEVEYEGSESFLKEELPSLLSAVSELYSKSHTSKPLATPDLPQNSDTQPTGNIEATTGSLAAKLQVKSGPDLIIAAAARLTFVSAKDKFSRQEIIDEMKTAPSYNKGTYINNLSRSLNNLIKDGKLNEPSKGNYALTASARKELETRLV